MDKAKESEKAEDKQKQGLQPIVYRLLEIRHEGFLCGDVSERPGKGFLTFGLKTDRADANARRKCGHDEICMLEIAILHGEGRQYFVSLLSLLAFSCSRSRSRTWIIRGSHCPHCGSKATLQRSFRYVQIAHVSRNPSRLLCQARNSFFNLSNQLEIDRSQSERKERTEKAKHKENENRKSEEP